MIIISHRGYWKSPPEKNMEAAFRRSFSLGLGTETDVRDATGSLVISHDMPNGSEMTLEALLALPGAAELPLALNIKSDGLAESLHEMAISHQINNWFVFDMSVADMRSHLKVGNPVFTRMSEVEQSPVWLDESVGVWLDGFFRDWYDAALVRTLLEKGKRVCVVSPELHARPFDSVWRMLFPLRMNDRLMLCTDFPERALQFFEITI